MGIRKDVYENDSLSVIEDLDPEAEEKPGTGRKREMLLGGALLVAVVVFALWQWMRQDYQARQYQAGRDAVNVNNWDAAIGYFEQAAGYSDADVFAENARRTVARRDSLYESASEHIERNEWLQALRDIREIGKIQPTYKDVEVKEELALEKVYDDALGGAVARRQAADPPGLYLRMPSAWVWLEGSDTRSTWLGNEGQDHIVYDVPSDEGEVTPTAIPGEGGDEPAYLFAGRSLVDAQVGADGITFTKMPVDPSAYPPVFVGKGGVWAVNVDTFREQAQYAFPFVRNYFWGSELSYQEYGSKVSETLELAASATYTEGEVLAFVDPNSDRYVLARWSNGHMDGPHEDTAIDVFAGWADGERRLVFTHKGGMLESAQISPDGRYMVVVTKQTFNRSFDMITASLLDLEGSGPARILKESTRYHSESDLLALTAAFVSSGAYQGKLLLAEYGRHGTQISLIDPALATGGAQAFFTLSTTTLPEDIASSWYIAQQDAQGVVLAANDTRTRLYSADPVTTTVHLLVLTPGGLPETYMVMPDEATNEIPRVIMDEKKITLVAHQPAHGEDEKEKFTVYEMARSADAKGVQDLRKIFTTSETTEGYSIYGMQTTLHMGKTLIAYTMNGELRVRTRDGTVDLMLERGAPVIYENYAYVFSSYLLR